MTTTPVIHVVLLSALIIQWICGYPARGAIGAGYDEFARLVGAGRSTEALELGSRLFRALTTEEPDDATLVLLSRRLDAARQIGTLVAGAVKPSQAKLLEGIAGMDDLGLALPASRDRGTPAALAPPAQGMYWTYLGSFTGKLTLDNLPAQQAAFLRRYYDLQMQHSIMKVGRQIAVTDPNSLENACYAMVLPLLYLHGSDNTWDQMESFLALFSPRQLDVLWRFSLLQAERLEASVQIARYQAKGAHREFSLVAWAPAAADACIANHRPDLAQELLRMAIDRTKDSGQAAELRLKIVEGYARCGDYTAAAQTCRQIANDLSDASFYGRTMALYFGYLAREAKADDIIRETEPALSDPRCKPYLPQILYLRWWALCKTNRQDEAVRIAQRLMEQYAGNPCVAPILLERATDALARQQYDRCQELLTKLMRDFPGTESSKRAEEILARFKGSGIQQRQDSFPRASN